MLKLTTTSYLHLFNTLNFNIFVPQIPQQRAGYSTSLLENCAFQLAQLTLFGTRQTLKKLLV